MMAYTTVNSPKLRSVILAASCLLSTTETLKIFLKKLHRPSLLQKGQKQCQNHYTDHQQAPKGADDGGRNIYGTAGFVTLDADNGKEQAHHSTGNIDTGPSRTYALWQRDVEEYGDKGRRRNDADNQRYQT